MQENTTQPARTDSISHPAVAETRSTDANPRGETSETPLQNPENREVPPENDREGIRGLVEDLQDEVRELRKSNEELRERVEELEDAREQEATVRWEGPNPANVEVTASDTGNSVYPYQALSDKVRVEDLDGLRERIEDIEEGRAEVVVRSETDPNALPIESRIARQQVGDDGMSANEERAAVVFPTFGGRAKTTGGTKLVMDSDTVRHILTEKTDKEDWHDETVKRTMRWVARLTSREDDSNDRSPRSDGNLITLQKRKGTLALVADRKEWIEWSKEASGRLAKEEP